MMDSIRRLSLVRNLWAWVIIPVVLLGAAFVGARPSVYWIALFVAAAGAAILLLRPILGLFVLVVAALMVPLQFGTGTEVSINLAVVLVPTLVAIWVLERMRRHEPVAIAPSMVNKPLWLFLLAGLFSLVIGNALWDPAVPRSNNLVLVQLAQWAIFAFSAASFWMMGCLIHGERWLRRLTQCYLVVAGALAIGRVWVPTARLLYEFNLARVVDRATFWLLLTAVAGGQLMFNRELARRWRLFLAACIGAAVLYAFVLQRATASNWVGVAAVGGVLAWLRFPRLRWPVIVLLVVMAISGSLFSSVYDFAGGESEWEESGGSRLALIGRVVEVTMRNPITGLGPAAYRSYAKMKPLLYGRAYYLVPWVNSHNNYVDLFSHVGLVGLGLFFWIAAAVTRLGLRLRYRFTEGFAAGYVNAMLAAWAASLMVMLLADWILPFVYNIGFLGFRASVLIWLFMGGLVVLDRTAGRESEAEQVDGTSA